MNDEAVGSCESRKSPQLLAFYNLIVISRFFSSFSTQFVFFFSVFFFVSLAVSYNFVSSSRLHYVL